MRVADLSGARASCYEKALPLYRQIEDRLGEANVLQAIGDLLMRVADLSGARASYEKALPLYRQIEARLGEANVLQAMRDFADARG
ncbi:MAG: tetratricopeptide repeat protein [Acidobacteriota bacterium]